MTGMVGRMVRAAIVACVGLALLAGSAGASGGDARREGSCTGHSDWRLEVDRRDGNTLRVRFRIEHTPSGKVWEVFLSDNGTRFFAATRTSSSNGEIRVRKNTKDRQGTDRVKAYAVSRATGEVCTGSVRFDH
jgi:hypothetical protein